MSIIFTLIYSMEPTKKRKINFSFDELNTLIQLVDESEILLLSGDTKANVSQRKTGKCEEIEKRVWLKVDEQLDLGHVFHIGKASLSEPTYYRL